MICTHIHSLRAKCMTSNKALVKLWNKGIDKILFNWANDACVSLHGVAEDHDGNTKMQGEVNKIVPEPCKGCRANEVEQDWRERRG